MLRQCAGSSPGMAFMPYCSLPELESAMNVWQLMEMIHSRSYTYIIKNVYPDASEVFDTVLDDDKIMSRAESVTAAYDELINAEHEFDSGNAWKFAAEGHPQELMTGKNSKGNSTEQSSTSTFLKALGFMSPSLARLHLVNSKLWKDPLRLSLLSPEMKAQHLVLTQQIIKKWQDGDDEEMVRIAEEEKPNVLKMFKNADDEEKAWASYLFKNGSMIGLNEKLLGQYVEFTANRRMKAIGIDPIYDISPRNNPLPWTQYWLNSKGQQNAPQETEIESYVIGGIKQDVTEDTFAGLSL